MPNLDWNYLFNNAISTLHEHGIISDFTIAFVLLIVLKLFYILTERNSK